MVFKCLQVIRSFSDHTTRLAIVIPVRQLLSGLLKEVGRNLLLSVLLFTSVTCEKSASSLIQTPQNFSGYSSSNTGSRRDDSYRTSRENSLELIELSSINRVSLV